MKIGINAYEAAVPRFGFNEKGLPNRVGSGEFCFQLISSLFKIDKENEYKIFLPIEPSKDMPKETEKWKYFVFQSKLWTLFGLTKKFLRSKEKLNVFLSPTHYLPLHVWCPSVISILDVSYTHYPELFKKKDLYMLKFWGKYSIKKASKIITISNSSKNDIIKAYGVNSEKINVIYPGIKPLIMGENNRRLIEKDYILFVGTLQPRKNISKLVEAFSKLKNKEIELIIVGKRGWMFEEILVAPQKYGVEDRVKFMDFVKDEDLPSLYKNALCFVLPSLYEGFGLPVLEAMQYGCPVVTSNVSSLPEAGGEAALYFDPESVQDMTEKIEKVISDSKLRESMVKKGYDQVKKFSWEKTAKETLEVLKDLVDK